MMLKMLTHARMLAVAGVAGLGLTAAAPQASASTHWSFGLNLGFLFAPAPVVVSQPVVAAPQVVYGAPVYAAPTVVCPPAPVVVAPPVYYVPAPVWFAPGLRHEVLERREAFERREQDHRSGSRWER